jgi:hypothetical protein
LLIKTIRFGIVIKQPTNASMKWQDFINAFLDLPQHVSASHCHHQGVVVSSEATPAGYIWMYMVVHA